jgi:NADH dehydrogenase [ubiquinone] 1 alpha subcomplex assembly factor 6
MPAEPSSQSHAEYCADQVRSYDYHRYFAATLAPGTVRRGLFALYAFNLEIAATRERVSEALLGQIRLQWWRETLDGIYAGTVRNHAVAEEIAHAVDAFGLARTCFDRMIDGRMFDLEDESPEDAGALSNYVSATSGALTRLAMDICGHSDRGDDAETVGLYWGLTGLLRASPHHARQNRVYLPKDMLRSAGVTREAVIEGKAGAAGGVAFTALAGLADGTGAGGIGFPKTARPAVAYAAIAAPYLRRLKRAGYDVYADGLELSRFGGQIRILRSALTGRL